MTTFRLEVPVWATLYIDAPTKADALALAAGLDQFTAELGDDLEPIGEGVELSAVMTLSTDPANWMGIYNPEDDIEQLDDEAAAEHAA